jgi:hypothetical protein
MLRYAPLKVFINQFCFLCLFACFKYKDYVAVLYFIEKKEIEFLTLEKKSINDKRTKSYHSLFLLSSGLSFVRTNVFKIISLYFEIMQAFDCFLD